MEGLTIGQLARESGVHRETIRYYERRGLVVRPPREASGFRRYPLETVLVIRFIKRAQGLGRYDYSLISLCLLFGAGTISGIWKKGLIDYNRKEILIRDKKGLTGYLEEM